MTKQKKFHVGTWSSTGRSFTGADTKYKFYIYIYCIKSPGSCAEFRCRLGDGRGRPAPDSEKFANAPFKRYAMHNIQYTSSTPLMQLFYKLLQLSDTGVKSRLVRVVILIKPGLPGRLTSWGLTRSIVPYQSWRPSLSSKIACPKWGGFPLRETTKNWWPQNLGLKVRTRADLGWPRLGGGIPCTQPPGTMHYILKP